MQKAIRNPRRGPARAERRGKNRAALSAQQTIPYLVMHPDGVCQLPGGIYTKTVEYEDINYSVDIVRGMSISLTDLPLLLQSIQNGGGATLGQSVPKSEDKEDSE